MPTTSLFQEWFYWLFEINTFRHLLTACLFLSQLWQECLCSEIFFMQCFECFFSVKSFYYNMSNVVLCLHEMTNAVLNCNCLWIYVHIYNSYYQPFMLKPWMVWECTWSVVCSSTLGTEEFLALYGHVLYEDSSYVPQQILLGNNYF